MEKRVTKLEEEVSKIWSEVKLSVFKHEQMNSSIEGIKSSLDDMKTGEVRKAIERQKMQSLLEQVLEMQRSYNNNFEKHIKDGVNEHKNTKKWLMTLTVVVIAIVVDAQSGTNIVSSVWSNLISITIGT